MKTIIAFALCLIALPSAPAHAADAARPNVILILADDLGAKELSCYGSTRHKTPNLDRMASQGLRFETFYAMPLCTPTRVALMTGQYGHHNGFLGMANPAFKPASDSPQAEIGNHFTHADLMKSRGYATAQVGKWQLSGKLPTLVRDCGFDEYCMWAYDQNLPAGVTHPAHEKGGNACRFWHPSIVQNGEYVKTEADDYGPDMFNQFVLDFARRHKQEPFFVYYTSVLTHGPHLETPNPTASDPKAPGNRWPAGFKSNLEYLDHLMGQLMSGLKSEGLDENTFIIFVGDNGTGSDGKGTTTELGARVPCIVRGPGIQPGNVSRALGDLTDIMPTLAELSGATLPTGQPFDGTSFVSVLQGKQAAHRPWIYSHLDDGRILRDSRWLLEIDRQGKGERFFDCGECRDGSTYKNVTGSMDAEAKQARARFAAILSSMPEPKPRVDDASASKPKPADSSRDARFAARDKNADGTIDHEEFMSTLAGSNKQAGEMRFKKMDENGDGKITKAEFLKN